MCFLFLGTLKIFKNVLISFTMYVHLPTLTTRELHEGFSLHLIRKSFTQLLSNCILHVKSYTRFNVNLSGVISYTFIEAKNVWCIQSREILNHFLPKFNRFTFCSLHTLFRCQIRYVIKSYP
jgi:hypothetical protein